VHLSSSGRIIFILDTFIGQHSEDAHIFKQYLLVYVHITNDCNQSVLLKKFLLQQVNIHAQHVLVKNAHCIYYSLLGHTNLFTNLLYSPSRRWRIYSV